MHIPPPSVALHTCGDASVDLTHALGRRVASGVLGAALADPLHQVPDEAVLLPPLRGHCLPHGLPRAHLGWVGHPGDQGKPIA